MTIKKLLPLLILPLLVAGCATEDERTTERRKHLCADYYFDKHIEKSMMNEFAKTILSAEEYIDVKHGYHKKDLRSGIEEACEFYKN